MKNNVQRCLSVLLLIVMMFSLCGSLNGVFAAEIVAGGECGAEGDNVTWTLDSEGRLTISGTGTIVNTRFAREYSVYEDIAELPQFCSVIIQNGITNIDTDAFYWGNCIHELIIPDSVTDIGGFAFFESRPDNITFGTGLTNIGYNAFSTELLDLALSLSDEVDLYYDNYDSGININICDIDSWLRISFATYGSNPLFPDGSLLIDGEIVYDVVVPENVTKINSYAFAGYRKLMSITIPANVTSIGAHAFYRCDNLKTIYFAGTEEQWNAIEKEREFDYELDEFEGITVVCNAVSPEPENADSGYCGEMGDDVAWVLDSDGVLTVSGSGKIRDFAFVNRPDIVSVVIRDGVKGVGDSAFESCKNLTSITLPDSVTDIGCEAFRNCRKLKEITIPDGVTAIKFGAFSGCGSLRSVTLPDCVEDIGNSAFEDCVSLVEITIPDGVRTISCGAFAGCGSLRSVVIPDGVTEIRHWAFKDCVSLTSVMIPEKIREIWFYAFCGCNNILDVFYAGTSAQWLGIHIYEGNEYLIDAEIHCKGYDTDSITTVTEDNTGAMICYIGGVYDGGVVLNVVPADANSAAFGIIDDLAPGQFVLYDITTTVDGEKVQPNGTVTVKLPIPAGFDRENLAVYFVSNEGEVEKLDFYIEDDFICFETTHFSIYAVVDENGSDNLCKYCGEPHEGFFGKLVAFFHAIFYFFAHLFGKM